jgi:hypothetical protein
MTAETTWHPTRADQWPAALTVYWRVWRRRGELDDLLIDGADAGSSPELTVRARQLMGDNHRFRLAAELETLVSAAERSDPSQPALDLCVEEVRAARSSVLRLAARLYDRPCSARGVAITRRLLRDPSSPVYEPAVHGELTRAARAAALALERA